VPSPTVALHLPSQTLQAGQQVVATLVNNSSSKLELASCPTLSERVNSRWVAITHTHGVDVACPAQNPATGTARAHSRQSITIELYDDLVPGTYRVALPYRKAGSGRGEPPFTSKSTPVATVTFHVLAFDPGPPPQLAESRILTIALTAAKRDGDAHPTLIQHAEGSALLANLVASGDLTFQWNWSYLIAMRGTFETPPIPTHPGIPTGPGPVRISTPVLTLVINARSGQVIGGDMSRRYPKLSRLGPVTTDRS
jgi:hypothetical protein